MLNSKLIFKKAVKQDFDLICNLLKKNSLPYDDVKKKLDSMFIVFNTKCDDVIGIAGVEFFKDCAFLRSIVVNDKFRKKGFGKNIINELFDYIRLRGHSEIYLLTMTAERFFSKLGFETIKRENTPKVIQETEQFKHLCPDSAICMRIRI